MKLAVSKLQSLLETRQLDKQVMTKKAQVNSHL